MTTIVNTKVGERRGKRRFYVEGKKLEREGISIGQRYDLSAENGRLVLKIGTEGKYTVSRKIKGNAYIPVIDLSAQQVAELFDGVQMVRAVIREGSIIVSAHHQQQMVEERVSRLMEKVVNNKPLDVISLFHGGGVIDHALHTGMELSGVKMRASAVVELEPAYMEASLSNNQIWDKDTIAIESGIQHVDMSRSNISADIIIGGIPCSGASRSGKSANKLKYAEDHSEAGAMFFYFLEFVRKTNPSIVLIENVPEYQQTASMAAIRSVLKSFRYSISERVLDGNEFGALERRKRLCVVAVSEGLEEFDIEQVEPLIGKPETIGDILEDLPLDSPRWKTFDYIIEKAKRDKLAGKGFQRQMRDENDTHCGTIGRGYAKCRSYEPFLKHPVDPALSRIFTPLEHARLKGVPEKLVQGLSDTISHQILGQSVIWPVFAAVGESLATHLRRCAGEQGLPKRHLKKESVEETPEPEPKPQCEEVKPAGETSQFDFGFAA
ncbi:DNA cytosine methyltransferase [Pseudovibrio ascidiaceicola]|uniref:DNA cytosine methyltransferase n=1 Tax=Pseudovibrio ascidiaceicola TaxID=285279 RepID=UPI003D35F6ED